MQSNRISVQLQSYSVVTNSSGPTISVSYNQVDLCCRINVCDQKFFAIAILVAKMSSKCDRMTEIK